MVNYSKQTKPSVVHQVLNYNHIWNILEPPTSLNQTWFLVWSEKKMGLLGPQSSQAKAHCSDHRDLSHVIACAVVKWFKHQSTTDHSRYHIWNQITEFNVPDILPSFAGLVGWWKVSLVPSGRFLDSSLGNKNRHAEKKSQRVFNLGPCPWPIHNTPAKKKKKHIGRRP